MLVLCFGYPVFLFMFMRMLLSMDTMKTTGQLICNKADHGDPIGLIFDEVHLFQVIYFESTSQLLSTRMVRLNFKQHSISKDAMGCKRCFLCWVSSRVCLFVLKSLSCSCACYAASEFSVPSLQTTKRKTSLSMKWNSINKIQCHSHSHKSSEPLIDDIIFNHHFRNTWSRTASN